MRLCEAGYDARCKFFAHLACRRACARACTRKSIACISVESSFLRAFFARLHFVRAAAAIATTNGRGLVAFAYHVLYVNARLFSDLIVKKGIAISMGSYFSTVD